MKQETARTASAEAPESEAARKDVNPLVRNCDTRSTDSILGLVARYYGISIKGLKSQAQNAQVTHPRQMYMLLAREAGFSAPQVAKTVKRDQSTILHGAQKMSESIAENGALQADYEKLSETIRQFRSGEQAQRKQPSRKKVTTNAPRRFTTDDDFTRTKLKEPFAKLFTQAIEAIGYPEGIKTQNDCWLTGDEAPPREAWEGLKRHFEAHPSQISAEPIQTMQLLLEKIWEKEAPIRTQLGATTKQPPANKAEKNLLEKAERIL